jgi:hypothetical protein
MPIILTISTLPDGSQDLSGFTQFWLRYVHGFSPQYHCQKCLKGKNDLRFHRKMEIGTSFELHEPDNYDFIYLCGINSLKDSGLHLALQPKIGAYAKALTFNEITITVSNAEQLSIPKLADGFAGMEHHFTSCCNWQFGVEYYGLAGLYKPGTQDFRN